MDWGKLFSFFYTKRQTNDAISSAVSRLENSWAELSLSWSDAPTKVSDQPTYEVYQYVKGAATVFRRVPKEYTPTQDTFFEAWDGENLAGEIISRG